MKKILSTRVLVKICVLTTILLVLIIYTIWGNSPPWQVIFFFGTYRILSGIEDLGVGS